MDPISMIGLGLSGAGILGGLFDEPEEVTFYPVELQKQLNLATSGFDFGQDEAQAAYQMAKGYVPKVKTLLDASMQSEIDILRKSIADTTPTLSTMRGYLSGQGIGASASNVIAGQQIRRAQRQAQEVLAKGMEGIGSQYSKNLAEVMYQGAGLEQGALGTYLGARGRATGASIEAERLNKQFAAQSYNQEMMFNRQGQFQASQANAGIANSYQSPWLTMGMSVLPSALSGALSGWGRGASGLPGVGGYAANRQSLPYIPSQSNWSGRGELKTNWRP